MQFRNVGTSGCVLLLADRLCIVTGAGQGLGRAVAVAMAAEGAEVHLLERNPETLADAVAAIRDAGGRAEGHALDVTDRAALARAMKAVAARGPVHALVNNAAVNPPSAALWEEADADWDRTLAVNLGAVRDASRLVAPGMIAAREGRIVHVSSVQGFVSSGRCGAYNAAKGAVLALTRSMAVELAPHGVLVNAVAPGFLDTPMSVVDGVSEIETPEFRDWYLGRGRIPLRRAGRPEDVAGTILFLCSDLCRWMTGQVLVVDGGMTATF